MANKNIVDLPASGALVSSDLLEKQVTGAGQNQKATLAQLLTFIQNNATAFAQAVNMVANFTIGGAGKFQVLAASGNVNIAGTAIQLLSDGSARFASADIVVGGANGLNILAGTILLRLDGSAAFAAGGFAINTDGQIVIGSLALTIFPADGSATIGNVAITAAGIVTTPEDIEISDTTNGLIQKSPNGTRYRLKVDNAGNLGTEPA